ncbi:Carbohydrate binding domain-containing protein [Bacteroidales bacterium KHT7]|nr:Carbohydrate binding domain-containing protein [Bacteroidales bacterium KHT7]
MKLYSKILTMVGLAATVASCSDVPAPYELNFDPTAAYTMPYKNASLQNNFNTITVNGIAWSLGSTYAKASGYNADDKSYTATEAWLVSPAINTTTTENAAYLSVDYVVRYGSKEEADLKANHRILASTDYAGDVTKATWTDLGFTPEQSNDWDFKTKEIALPEGLVNKERVVFAFVYKSGDKQAECSTWELENFLVKAGVPVADEPTPTPDPTPTVEPTGEGTLASPYNVAKALAIIKAGTYTTDEVYVSGIISQIDDIDTGNYGNSTYYISDDGKTPTQLEVFRGYSVNGEKFKADDEIKVGDKVVVLGKLTLYKETPEFAQGSKIVSLNGNGGTVEPTPEPTPDPVGENLLSNGGFETWADGLPTGWKSASTASNATLSQSTTAKSGSYSVLVEGATANKRLASAEMTLAAGTYKFSVFYKSAEAGVNGSIQLGYATVDAENKVNYVYSNNYVDSSDEWKEQTNTFTLEAETKICLVVMNSKKPGKSVLIDDASLYAVQAASAKKR